MAGLASTAIAVGGQLLGGIFGSKNTTKESWKGSYGALVGHAQGAIEGARRTGFNPLTLLGASPASGIPGDNSAFGQSVANASLLLADELSTNKATVDKLNAYQTQNLRLQRRLDTVSVRTPVPGVYGGARQPSDPEVYGGTQADGIVASGEAGETRPLDREYVSGLGGDADYSKPDSVTGPQASVAQDVPAFRAFGHDFYGSGLFSSGQQVEDAIGEGPLQWAVSPVLAFDAVGNEAYKWGARVAQKRWKRDLVRGYDRARPDRSYDGYTVKPRRAYAPSATMP